jgi:hypothetical protein
LSWEIARRSFLRDQNQSIWANVASARKSSQCMNRKSFCRNRTVNWAVTITRPPNSAIADPARVAAMLLDAGLRDDVVVARATTSRHELLINGDTRTEKARGSCNCRRVVNRLAAIRPRYVSSCIPPQKSIFMLNVFPRWISSLLLFPCMCASE